MKTYHKPNPAILTNNKKRNWALEKEFPPEIKNALALRPEVIKERVEEMRKRITRDSVRKNNTAVPVMARTKKGLLVYLHENDFGYHFSGNPEGALTSIPCGKKIAMNSRGIPSLVKV